MSPRARRDTSSPKTYDEALRDVGEMLEKDEDVGERERSEEEMTAASCSNTMCENEGYAREKQLRNQKRVRSCNNNT